MIYKYKNIEYHIKELKFPSEISSFFTRGWGNGYVTIDENHPWYGLGYDEVPVWIHGGLTYGNSGTFGFDTAHAGDNTNYWTEDRVLDETRWLAIQFYLQESIEYDEYIEKYKRDVVANEIKQTLNSKNDETETKSLGKNNRQIT
jgi:hypothetical protein